MKGTISMTKAELQGGSAVAGAIKTLRVVIDKNDSGEVAHKIDIETPYELVVHNAYPQVAGLRDPPEYNKQQSDAATTVKMIHAIEDAPQSGILSLKKCNIDNNEHREILIGAWDQLRLVNVTHLDLSDNAPSLKWQCPHSFEMLYYLTSDFRNGFFEGITHLDLSNNGLGRNGELCDLAQVLQFGTFQKLINLNLSKNNFGLEGLSGLTNMCQSDGILEKLEHLDLSDNALGNGALLYLIEAGKAGALANLQSLNLSNNKIPAMELSKLAQSHKAGSFVNLKHIYLDGTDIDDQLMTLYQQLLNPIIITTAANAAAAEEASTASSFTAIPFLPHDDILSTTALLDTSGLDDEFKTADAWLLTIEQPVTTVERERASPIFSFQLHLGDVMSSMAAQSGSSLQQDSVGVNVDTDAEYKAQKRDEIMKQYHDDMASAVSFSPGLNPQDSQKMARSIYQATIDSRDQESVDGLKGSVWHHRVIDVMPHLDLGSSSIDAAPLPLPQASPLDDIPQDLLGVTIEGAWSTEEYHSP